MSDDDIPRVDADDVPDGAFDDVDKLARVSTSGRAESLVASFTNDFEKAAAAAMWHTIIDDAGHEAFVDSLSVDVLRDAIDRVRVNGYADDALSVRDIYGDEQRDTAPSGAAFFAGDRAADLYHDTAEDMKRVESVKHGGDGGYLPDVDGFVFERSAALPSNIIVFIDVDAVARVPPDARSVQVGATHTPAVSSPIVVRDPGGIAIINVDGD